MNRFENQRFFINNSLKCGSQIKKNFVSVVFLFELNQMLYNAKVKILIKSGAVFCPKKRQICDSDLSSV